MDPDARDGLRQSLGAPADLDTARLPRRGPSDRRDVRRSVPPDGGDPAEAPLALQLLEVGVGEDAPGLVATWHPPAGQRYADMVALLLRSTFVRTPG